MARTLSESSNYREPITMDGTDSGAAVGAMSATVDTANRSFNVAIVLTSTSLPTDSVIQTQVTDFITQVRAQAKAAGLTQFSEPTVANS